MLTARATAGLQESTLRQADSHCAEHIGYFRTVRYAISPSLPQRSEEVGKLRTFFLIHLLLTPAESNSAPHSLVRHFFSKTSLATLMAVTTLGQPA